MTYSYTQISQYLACPRRYKYRYLEGWKERDNRPTMRFGRAFEQALAAYFRREDPGAVWFREWAAHRESYLEYSHRDTWDRMLQQGIQLLERFAQEDRVRIRQPRRNLQIKFTRPISSSSSGNDFVAYVDAIGKLDGTRLSAGVEDHFQPLSRGATRATGSGSPADLLLLDDRHPGRCSDRVRSQTAG